MRGLATPPTIAVDNADDAPQGDASQGGVDYASCYRILDLPVGASLRDIEDRIRLLRVAFRADDMPKALARLAIERGGLIEFAAKELQDYWQTHGKAPSPAGRTGDNGLRAALLQALGGSPE